MGRLPDRRGLIRALLVLVLLPIVLGGKRAASSHASVAVEPAVSPETPLWVFFSADRWESQASYEALLRAGAKIRHRSEWLRAVSLEISEGSVWTLGNIPGVVAVRPVARAPLSTSLPPQFADSSYGGLGESLDELGVLQAHEMGFWGSGVRVGILDGTFMDGHVSLRKRPPLSTRDFVDQDASVYSELADLPGSDSHGTALWSLISGDFPGLIIGSAPGVDILLARIRGFDPLSLVDEDRWVAGLEWLESQGARIVLSGIGFREFSDASYSFGELDGDGTPATRAADQAAQRGVLVVAPVGNGGSGIGTLEAPSDGDSVLAVGAVDSRGFSAAFSAFGPTADGRAKPDLYAPGMILEAASGAGSHSLEQVSGTEFAAALLSGALALAVEAHPDRGPIELLEMFKLAVPEVESGEVGVPNTAAAIVFPHGLFPLPLQEVNGEGEVTNLSPLFQWTAPTIHPVGLPVTFHLELAEDSLFHSIILSDSVVGTFARRPLVPLPPRTRLFWRIRGESIQGVERATPYQGPITVPSWVTLEVLNDPSGSELVDPQPEFRWSSPDLPAPSGPFSYELQILGDRDPDIIQSYPGLEESSLILPAPLPFNLPMRWRVIAQALGEVADTVTSAGPFVVTSGANPPATLLYQNFPNPFPNTEFGGMSTRIWFDLAEASTVELALYDVRGRLVRQLIPGPGCGAVELDPGLYGREDAGMGDPCTAFSWNGLDEMGRAVEPGVYLLRLRAGGVMDIRRVVYWP
jgi:hypothetical protein